jgi:hypothetical protein
LGIFELSKSIIMAKKVNKVKKKLVKSTGNASVPEVWNDKKFPFVSVRERRNQLLKKGGSNG